MPVPSVNRLDPDRVRRDEGVLVDCAPSVESREIEMHLPVADSWFAALWLCAGLTTAAAADCEVERYTAADAVVRQVELLRFASEPYRAAMATGDLASFDEVAPLVAQHWNFLMLRIALERRRLRENGCRDDGFTEQYRLPAGWTIVRDIGAEAMTAGDRAITIRHASAHATMGTVDRR
jgi:hypothetical protein